MTIILPILLIVFTVLYALLESSFKSFSLLSLVRYIRDQEIKVFKKLNFEEKFKQIENTLSAFSFMLKLVLFVYIYSLENLIFNNAYLRIASLLIIFLLFFSLGIPLIAEIFKNFILKRIVFLYRIPWFFFYPYNILASRILRGKWNKGENSGKSGIPSEKEMEIFIEEGRKEGILEREDKEMIESILEFGDILVKEIMTPRVDMIYIPDNIGEKELVKLIKSEKRSRYPVIHDKVDNIIGIIISKDIFNFLDGTEEFSIKSILRSAYFVPETMRIMVLLNEMQKKKQKFAVVIDEFGGVSGIITVEDIVEEIVGEIHDEFDIKTDHIVRNKDHYIVKGETEIEEINDKLKIGLDEQKDYQTITGLLSYKLGRIPKTSDIISQNDYIFEVLETEKNRVKRVRIYKSKN
jgi:CBS domain containing-hemolysin-like protein